MCPIICQNVAIRCSIRSWSASTLATHAAEHVSGRGSAREGVTSKGVARAALRKDLDAIVRTARAMSLENPGLEGKFRAPRSSGDLTMLNVARAFVRDAAPLEKDFLAFSMPEDFLVLLQQHIQEFEDAIRDRHAGTEAHVTARAALDQTMESALNALYRLDAVVPNRLHDNPTALIVWKRARRLASPSRRGEAATSPESQHTPAPAPSSLAAVT
jgi:hypothetical protein